MVNRPGRDVPLFERGQVLSAHALNRIVHALIKRIVGAEPIQVREASQGHLVISTRQKPGVSGVAASTETEITIGLANIITETGSGVYTFETYKGSHIGTGGFTAISNTAGPVSVTISGNGPPVTLSSGAGFALGSDNTPAQLAVTATNLAAAINANGSLTPYMTATASGKKVGLSRLPGANPIVLSTDHTDRISADSPSVNSCKELNLSTGITPGTRVVVHLAEDEWWFFFPVTTV